MNKRRRAISTDFRALSALSVLLILVALASTYSCSRQAANVVWLDELGPEYAISGWGEAQANKSIDGNPLTIAGQVYERGLGTHAEGMYRIKLDGKATQFSALVGIDDEIKGNERASVEFIVSARDKNNITQTLWKSGIIKAGQPAKEVNVSLDGLLYLDLIVSDTGDGSGYDHADWCEAKIEYRGTKPEPVKPYASQPYVLTPLPGPEPRINGANKMTSNPITTAPNTCSIKDLPA